jgi:hypothetical protein
MHRFIIGEDYHYITQTLRNLQGKNVKKGKKYFARGFAISACPPKAGENVGIKAWISRLGGMALRAYVNMDVRNLKTTPHTRVFGRKTAFL